MIEKEELLAGQALPAEREICVLQGISRMTVNKAIISLVNEGILYREQGKGTFVCKGKENQQFSQLKSFTELMIEKGIRPKTKLISFKVLIANKKIKSHLSLKAEQAKVIEIIRVRYSEDTPMVIETVYIPFRLCPDMTKEMIENNSLYDLLKTRYKYSFSKAKETIEPITLTRLEGTLLSQMPDALALKISRVTYTVDEVPLEYSKSILRSDKYKYEVILNR